jgi:hypothetical protein
MIQSIQSQSNAAWEMAVDTAGPEYAGGSRKNQKAMQSLADSCDSCYDAAIASLEAEGCDYDAALESLRQARHLESEGGDCAHADEAIAAVEAHVAALDLVTVEEMPNHLRSSHRTAGNWGVYPANGATRRKVSRREADEIVEADADEYDHIVA